MQGSPETALTMTREPLVPARMTPPAAPAAAEGRTDVATIPALVRRARACFDAGTTRSLEWRRSQLGRLRALLTEHRDEILAVLHHDLGKPPLEAETVDISTTLAEIDLASRNLDAWTRPEKVATPLTQQPATARVVREPLGVVLIIAPWNYPVQLLLSPLVGALAAGNAVVLKPSEVAVHTSALLARLVPQYLDRDAVALVEGAVPETSALLAERFDHIFYTGNGTVGRVVMAAAAKHLTPVTLELGGKSPCIVDRDADLGVAARRIAWGKFVNAGQTCIAPDYVLVHAAREQELIERLGSVIREFYGDDPQRSPDFARIVNARHVERLAGLMGSGQVALGGRIDPADRYVAPTVLRNVAPDAPIMQEEIFGPLLPVLTVADLESAIAFVNARPRPLALYVFSGNAPAQRAVVERTSSGGVCVNGTIWHVLNSSLPFGGVGPSGMGAYHGRWTFEVFSHRKSVVTRATWVDLRLAYPPYTAAKTALIRRLL